MDYDLDKCVVCGTKMPNLDEPTCSLECEIIREEKEERKKIKQEKTTLENLENIKNNLVIENGKVVLEPHVYEWIYTKAKMYAEIEENKNA